MAPRHGRPELRRRPRRRARRLPRPGAEITDVFAFLDPIDNGFAVIAMGANGFIPPGENNNLGAFDPDARFQFDIIFASIVWNEGPGVVDFRCSDQDAESVVKYRFLQLTAIPVPTLTRTNLFP